MAQLALAWAADQPRWMSQPNDDDAEAKLLGRALAYLRREAGKSQEAAGIAAGFSGQNWGKFERGVASSIFQPSVQAQLARAVNADVETLMMVRARLAAREPVFADRTFSDRDKLPPAANLIPRELTIRQRLQAAWSFDDDQMTYGKWPILPDPRHGDAEQWLAEIMDDHAQGLGLSRGDLVQCVKADDIGLYPRTGDLVIVERRRPVEERELTIRQVENAADGVRLWARSSNPRLAQPLRLPSTLYPNPNDEGPRILALVTASIRRY